MSKHELINKFMLIRTPRTEKLITVNRRSADKMNIIIKSYKYLKKNSI